jgi:hypothetical protein
MKTLLSIAEQLFGLFVDDWRTSAAAIAWFAIVALALPIAVRSTETRSVLLFAGLALVLIASVAIGARERSAH